MIVSKFTSSKECVEAFYANTGTQNELLDDDIRLHVAELVDIIGSPYSYIQKVIGPKQDPNFQMTNYKIPLPCDFFRLVPGGIAFNGQPVLWRESSFHHLLDGECCNLQELNNTSLEIFTDQFGNEFSPQAGSPNFSDFCRTVSFDIHNGYLVFDAKEGSVCMAYLSYPVDSEGYMLIPDTAKYKRAVTDYLIWKSDYISWRQGALKDNVYQESKNNKDWSIASVSAELKLPDGNQLESMKNTLIRLLPKFNSYNHFFKDINSQERRTFK